MRIVFLGSGEFGVPTLEALARTPGYEVVGVVTQPDRPAGRKRVLTPTPVGEWVGKNAPTLGERGLLIKPEDANIHEVVERVRAMGADAGVVIAFGQKLSPELIGALGKLAVNLHASLLPKYRGAAPINWAIIRGEKVTGVSVIGLAQRMDAGAVYAQGSREIRPEETAGELHDELAKLGPEAVLKVLRDLEAGTLTPIAQDESQATKAPKFKKEDGTVDFAQSAASVRNRVHGLTPWPGCRVAWVKSGDGEVRDLIVGRVRVVGGIEPTPGGRGLPGLQGLPGEVGEGLRVACAEGEVVLVELQAPGTRMMPAAEFARGRGLGAGDVLKRWEFASTQA